ncbi:MAG: FkbM family methyltransferase [Fibrobacterota bacterium]
MIPVLPNGLKRFLKLAFYRYNPFCYAFIDEPDLPLLRKKIDNYFSLFFWMRKRYQKELEFLTSKADYSNPFSFVYPYSFVLEYDFRSIDVREDKSKGLYYVNHKGKRLYYSRAFTSTQAVQENHNLITFEQDKRSPHRYVNHSFAVDDNDIVLDVGAAEGNFSLGIVEKVKKLYIFETDPLWIEALNATFEPWKEKVHIVNKYVSDVDSEHSICLDNFFTDQKVDFIKVDVEGAEASVLSGARGLIRCSPSLKIAICTYHRKNDAKKIKHFLSKNSFDCSFTEGYILFVYAKLCAPFFRKGILRARRRG